MRMRILTEAEQNAWVLERASQLLAEHDSSIEFADATADTGPSADALELEALRCARSRFALERSVKEARATGPWDDSANATRVELSVVWAMYGETERIRPFSRETNPHGEDFLREKIAQVRWLTEGLDIAWHLIAVDDGCPELPNSASVARSILESESSKFKEGERVTVLELGDVLGQSVGPGGVCLDRLHEAFHLLPSPDQSRKGGSIVYGLLHAIETSSVARPELMADHRSRHVVMYTDADLSANLAQAGLLAAPILSGKSDGVVGQRYGLERAILVNGEEVSVEPRSTGSKPDNMIVLFRHFVRKTLMPDIAHVLDTQAGFKAFDADALNSVIGKVSSFNESFDVELLLHFTESSTETRDRNLAVEPIVFVEDFESSNFPSVDPGQRHLDMIDQLVAIYYRLVAPGAGTSLGESQPMLTWLGGLTLEGYIATVDYLKAKDNARRRVGKPDPLFESDWPLEELRLASKGIDPAQVAAYA